MAAHRGAAQSQLVLATRGGHEGASSSPQVTAGYDGSSWPRHDGLKWPHLVAVAAAGMVVSA